MLPATKRGLSGVRRVKSSAARRARVGGGVFSSTTCSSQLELGHADGVAVERVGRDDVGAGVQIGAVDILDQLGLGEDHDSVQFLSATGWLRKRAPR